MDNRNVNISSPLGIALSLRSHAQTVASLLNPACKSRGDSFVVNKVVAEASRREWCDEPQANSKSNAKSLQVSNPAHLNNKNKRVEWYPDEEVENPQRNGLIGITPQIVMSKGMGLFIALPSASLNYMGDGCLVGGGNYSLQECPKKIPAFPYLQLMRAVFKVFILLYQLCWFMRTQSKRGSRSFWFIQYLVRNECSCFSSPRQVIRQDLFGAV